MPGEAELHATEHGLVPDGEGWFVLNAKDARWFYTDDLGVYCGFEGDPRFAELGINLNVLRPGEPMAMYHADKAQEDFLVLSGECVVIVNGEERPLRAWDLFHCPEGVPHVIVGAGDGPSLVLAAGARPGQGKLVYPVDEAALRHGAGVEEETSAPAEAYKRFTAPEPGPYRDGLP